MDTSKTSVIKSLLMKAWRERWTDVKWGINIKNVLPRGVSGDVYDLADFILQQALVGPSSNELIISYLIHSLSANVVSYGAVLASIGRCVSFYKPNCILRLLELLKGIQTKIKCRGNEEECIGLCKALVSVTLWLYSCILYSLAKITELKQSPDYTLILEKSCEILNFILNSNFLKALFYVGKYEDPATYNQLLQKYKELENKYNQSSSKEMLETSLKLTMAIDSFPTVYPAMTRSGIPQEEPFSSTFIIMLAIDGILNPASDIDATAEQLILMKGLQDLSMPDLYCEIFRACFRGLIDSSEPEERKWPAFTFLKVPNLILKIHTKIEGKLGPNGSHEVELGFEKIINYKSLLDLAYTKSNCDCPQHIITKLSNFHLLSKTQMTNLLGKCNVDATKMLLKQDYQPKPRTSLIIHAEGTVISILKSLETDYSKIQRSLLSILSHMVPAINFEIILSALTATGNLPQFTKNVIIFNEFTMRGTNENAECAQTRALLFDITFLMLTHIVQYYGVEVITENPETKYSFFAKWISAWHDERERFKNPNVMQTNNKEIDFLLKQFNSPESEFEMIGVNWDEVCINVPMALKHILNAWEHLNLSTGTVKEFLDNIKRCMCFIPVCVSAWLCNYINVLHSEERLKPMNMLHQLMTPLNIEINEPNANSNNQSSETSTFYKERSCLMSGIIKKMMHDLHPLTQVSKGMAGIPFHLTSQESMWELLDSIFMKSYQGGWIDLTTIPILDSIFHVGGPVIFCEKLVMLTLSFENREELNKAVNMSLGIMHLDIEQCALALLFNILPNILHFKYAQDMLSEPKGSALARLAVLATYSALQAAQYPQSTYSGKRYCRRNRNLDFEEFCNPPDRNRKMRRGLNDAELMEDTPYCLQSSNDEPKAQVPEPLKKVIADFMKHLFNIAGDSAICQRSLFPLLFLEQVVLCAKDKAYLLLQFMPLGLMPLLIKIFPEFISHQIVIAVSSLQTSLSRKVLARTLCQLTILQNRLQKSKHDSLGIYIKSENI